MVGDKLLHIMQETNKNSLSSATEMLFGEVVSTSPLKIKVDNRFEISSSFIVLTSLVSDFYVDATLSGQTGSYVHSHEVTQEGTTEPLTVSSDMHSHLLNDRITIKMHLGLAKGEKVILLRVQGGQKFIVIDRVR